jgi:hypothetical protein
VARRVHRSAVLRARDGERAAEQAAFVDGLRVVAAALARLREKGKG